MIDQFSEPGTDVMPYEMKVIPAGDGVAIVTYNVVLRVPAAEDQGPPPRYQHFSTVWVKQGDMWRMKFYQMTASHWETGREADLDRARMTIVIARY